MSALASCGHGRFGAADERDEAALFLTPSVSYHPSWDRSSFASSVVFTDGGGVRRPLDAKEERSQLGWYDADGVLDRAASVRVRPLHRTGHVRSSARADIRPLDAKFTF